MTFATDDLAGPRDALVASAHGSAQFDDVFVWDEDRLREDPGLRGDPVFAHRRGVGFWSWKPHIILDTMSRVDGGDVVLYSDVGRYRGGFTVHRDIGPLVEFCERNGDFMPGVLVPNFGPNSRWTKRDCFVLMDCDSPSYWSHPQVQATFSVWLKTERSIRFLTDWRRFCSDIRIVGDGPNTVGLPNLPGFVDHRHDQSILTNLVLKLDATPFVVESRLFRSLSAARPKSLSASLVVKDVDNVTAIAAGTHPVRLLAREIVNSAFLGRLVGTPFRHRSDATKTIPPRQLDQRLSNPHSDDSEVK